jgi:hypothetical protein
MIHTDRASNSIERLVRIKGATSYSPRGDDPLATDILHLTLEDEDGQEVELWLDEDGIVRHLERAVGQFKEAKEIVGKRLIAVTDRAGDIVTFHVPFEGIS